MEKHGKLIRELRDKHGDTREELAQKLGMSESGLGKIERGERAVKIELLEEIAKLYNESLSYFYGKEEQIPSEIKEIGAEWITFAKEMKERELTPEQIKATLELIEKLNIGKK